MNYYYKYKKYKQKYLKLKKLKQQVSNNNRLVGGSINKSSFSSLKSNLLGYDDYNFYNTFWI